MGMLELCAVPKSKARFENGLYVSLTLGPAEPITWIESTD